MRNQIGLTDDGAGQVTIEVVGVDATNEEAPEVSSPENGAAPAEDKERAPLADSQTLSSSPEVNRTRLSAVSINGGGNTATVLPGSPVNVSLDLQIYHHSTCPGCIYQVLVGFSGEVREACVFNGVTGSVDNPTRRRGMSFSVSAPTEPGTYYLVFDSDAEFSCKNAMTENTPIPTDSARRFGVVRVEAGDSAGTMDETGERFEEEGDPPTSD